MKTAIASIDGVINPSAIRRSGVMTRRPARTGAAATGRAVSWISWRIGPLCPCRAESQCADADWRNELRQVRQDAQDILVIPPHLSILSNWLLKVGRRDPPRGGRRS